jgi:hypothetical protein
MSEYQRIAFRAIDGPVSEKNLQFMRRQSTRAEITAWAFDNEYSFGDFHGKTAEMLRRGYDFFLHYANYGIRTLMFRLPYGLPDFETAKLYVGDESLRFEKDEKGPGGILRAEPYFVVDTLEELWEIDEMIEGLVGVRAEILDGDLRPMYLMHLAIGCDNYHDPEETKEGPTPAGLKKLSRAQQALAKFFGLSEALLAAAAEGSPTEAAKADHQMPFTDWLRDQPEPSKDRWLAEWMADPRSGARRELLDEFRKSAHTSAWPTARRDRTIAELEARAEVIHSERSRKAEEAATRQRLKKLADMAADPSRTLRKTQELVAQRTTKAYQEIAALLADLRESLAGTAQSNLAEQQAWKLKNENPTLHTLTTELRRQGFVPKATGRPQRTNSPAESRGVKKAME